MTQPPRILLVSLHEIVVDPPSDQVVQGHWEPGNLRASEIRPLEVTHWALASNCKALSSTTLMQAAMAAQPPVVLVLPLEGCEWVGPRPPKPECGGCVGLKAGGCEAAAPGRMIIVFS